MAIGALLEEPLEIVQLGSSTMGSIVVPRQSQLPCRQTGRVSHLRDTMDMYELSGMKLAESFGNWVANTENRSNFWIPLSVTQPL